MSHDLKNDMDPVGDRGHSAAFQAQDEAKIVDHHRLDHLYNYPFRNDAGKYFAVVTSDPDGAPTTIDAEHPWPTRNKVKTRLTFIKSEDGGRVTEIEFKRFKYYAQPGYVEQEETIKFSFPFFVSLIGFLQGFSQLNLNDITERRIPLGDSPSLDAETVRQFNTLVSTTDGQALIREAIRNGHVTSEDLVNIGYRKTQLRVFEQLLSSPGAVEEYRSQTGIKRRGDEAVWQHFFENNTWIFGYGLNFIFNEPLQGRRLETTIRGHDVAGSGKRADGALKTAGIVSALCLVEIKTPGTDLLENEPYRPDCWAASKELSGAISQSQKTVQKTVENVAISPELRPETDEGAPTGEVVFSYRPKSFLIVGSLAEFNTPTGVNKEKYASFQLLRRNSLEPEVITFDELFYRAKMIIANS